MTPFRTHRFKISFFFLIAVCIYGCQTSSKIDTSNVDVNLVIQRFDQDLAKVRVENLSQDLGLLRGKYGVFYDDYFLKILNIDPHQPEFLSLVTQIIKGSAFKDLQHETDSVYPSLDKYKPEIEKSFTNIKALYKEWKVPKIITYISGFQVQTPIGSGYVGLGLDMFLGHQSKFYPALVESVPRYISRRFTPENITPRLVEVVTREDLFPELAQDQSLLQKMVYNGKLMYFMQQVQPESADSIIIGYTKKQLEWSHQYESDIWAYFMENDLLFETDYLKIQKFLAEAPFTPGIGSNNESAPKLGVFIGWQIVKRFMEENDDYTIQKLMLEKDAQKILRLAKYRPNIKD